MNSMKWIFKFKEVLGVKIDCQKKNDQNAKIAKLEQAFACL